MALLCCVALLVFVGRISEGDASFKALIGETESRSDCDTTISSIFGFTEHLYRGKTIFLNYAEVSYYIIMKYIIPISIYNYMVWDNVLPQTDNV